MATMADMRTNLRSHLVLDSTILTDAICDEFVNTTIERMQAAHDWHLQQGVSSPLSYGTATDGVALPTDFVTEVALHEVNLTATDPSLQLLPIPKLEGGRAAWTSRVHAPDVSTTFPVPEISGRYYFLWAGYLYLVPQPTSTITLQLDYIKSQADLSGSSSNAFLTTHPRTVLWGALYLAKLWHHEWEQAEAILKVYSDLLNAAMKRDVSSRIGGGAKSRGA